MEPIPCQHLTIPNGRWAVKSGMQPGVLQKILGQAKHSTTAEIYVHADIEQLVKAVEETPEKKKKSAKAVTSKSEN